MVQFFPCRPLTNVDRPRASFSQSLQQSVDDVYICTALRRPPQRINSLAWYTSSELAQRTQFLHSVPVRYLLKTCVKKLFTKEAFFWLGGSSLYSTVTSCSPGRSNSPPEEMSLTCRILQQTNYSGSYNTQTLHYTASFNKQTVHQRKCLLLVTSFNKQTIQDLTIHKLYTIQQGVPTF